MATEVYHVSYKYTASTAQYVRSVQSAQRLTKSFDKTLAMGRASLRSYGKAIAMATTSLTGYNNALRRTIATAKGFDGTVRKTAKSSSKLGAANATSAIKQRALNKEFVSSTAKMKAYGLVGDKTANTIRNSAKSYNVLSNAQRNSISSMTEYTSATRKWGIENTNARNSIMGTSKTFGALNMSMAKSVNYSNQTASAFTRITRSKLDGTLKRVGQAAETTANKMMPLSIAAAAVFYGIVKVGSSFEKNFANVAKTVQGNVGVTDKNLNILKRQLIDLSRTIPIPFEKLTEYATMAGQMSVPIGAIKDFTEVFAQLEVATDLAGESGAKLFAQYMNIMGLKFNKKNITEFGDTLVHLGNNTAATEKDILALAQRLAPTARIMKLTSNQTLGLSAGLAQLGQKPQFAAGAFQRLSRTISLAVDKGGADLQGFADLAGTTSKEFASTWRNDPLKAIEMVSKGLKRTAKDQTDAFAIMKDLKIVNTQDARLLLVMASNWNKIDDAINLTKDSHKALVNEFLKKNDTVAARFQVMQNIIQSIGNSLFEKITPSIKKIQDAFNDFLIDLDDGIRNLSPKAAGIITIVTGVIAALFPITLIGAKIIGGLGGVFTAVKFVASAFEVLSTGVASASAGVNALAGAFRFVSNIISKLLGPIGLVIAVLVLLYTQFESFRDMVNDVLAAAFIVIQDVFNSIVDAVKRVSDAFKRIGESFNGVLQSMTPFIDMLVAVLKPILLFLINMFGATLKNAIDGFATTIENVAALIEGVVTAIGQLFSGDFSGAAETIGKTFGDIFDNIVEFAKRAVKNIVLAFARMGINIMPFIVGVVNFFKTAWETIKSVVTSVVDGIITAWNGFTTAIGVVFDVVVAIVKGAVQLIMFPFLVVIGILVTLWETFGDSIMSIFSAVGDFIKGAWDGLSAFFTGFINGLVAIFTGAFDGLKAIVTGFIAVFMVVFSPIISFVGNILKGIQMLFSSIWNAISGVVSKVITKITDKINTIKAKATSIMNTVKSVFSSAWNAIAGLVGGVISGIVGKFTSILNKAKSVTSGIKNAFTGAFDSIASSVKGVIDGILGWLGDMAAKGKEFLDKLNPFKYEFNYNGDNDPIPFGKGGDTYNEHTYNITMKDTSASSIIALKNKEVFFE